MKAKDQYLIGWIDGKKVLTSEKAIRAEITKLAQAGLFESSKEAKRRKLLYQRNIAIIHGVSETVISAQA